MVGGAARASRLLSVLDAASGAPSICRRLRLASSRSLPLSSPSSARDDVMWGRCRAQRCLVLVAGQHLREPQGHRRGRVLGGGDGGRVRSSFPQQDRRDLRSPGGVCGRVALGYGHVATVYQTRDGRGRGSRGLVCARGKCLQKLRLVGERRKPTWEQRLVGEPPRGELEGHQLVGEHPMRSCRGGLGGDGLLKDATRCRLLLGGCCPGDRQRSERPDAVGGVDGRG